MGYRGRSPGRYRKGPTYVRDERRDQVVYEGPDAIRVPSDIGEPEFSSIEEWLGANTEDYYRVLAHTGHGSWQPRDDAHLWLAFSLRAHHMQAQTVARRVNEAGLTWAEFDQLITEHGLPERTMDAMFDAVLGYRVRRALYLKRSDITEQTATRDLAALASEGILIPQGIGRGRYYVAGEPIRQIQERRRGRRLPLRDPYPWMRAKLGEPAEPVADLVTTT